MNQDQNFNPKNLNVWLPLLFAVVLVAGMMIGMRMQVDSPAVVVEAQEEIPSATLGTGKLEELVRYIEAKYVDEVDRDQLIDEAIASVLEELDPHSSYIPADQLQEINEQLEGNFEGIGVEFLILDDTIVVVSALSGGPSEIAGLIAGDKIVEVGDSVIAGQGLAARDVQKLLRGERGSKVEVGIRRSGEPNLRRFTITRDKIPMQSVDISYMVDDKTGYIKINRFSATTYEEFMKALEEMVEKQRMEDLIIDLRHNPGGYLQQATNILSQLFQAKDKLLVYTEGRSVHRSNYESTGRAFYELDDIVVLIDEGSASASEILAGAIQDHDRGYIIGRRSFGKGLVQEQYRLRDGSALRLTVARYYTPSGRSIQRAYNDLDDYENDMQNRFDSGELTDVNRMAIVDTTRYYTDGGRIVYSGGGIMPDIFVPLDTLLLNDSYLRLRQHVPQFVFRYLELHPAALDAYADLTAFVRRYQVSEGFYREFLAYAENNGEKIPARDQNLVKNQVKRFIKARLAKHKFEDLGFYTVWNDQDPVIQKAREAIRSSRPITSTETRKEALESAKQ